MRVLTTVQIMDALKAKGISNADAARLLGIAPSRIKEIRDGERHLRHEEAVKLVDAFKLEGEAGLPPPISPLNAQAARLVVRWVARSLAVDVSDQAASELATDLQAFFLFVSAHPNAIRDFETFLESLAIRRAVQVEAPPEDRPSEAQ
jgi:hypothetical protein